MGRCPSGRGSIHGPEEEKCFFFFCWLAWALPALHLAHPCSTHTPRRTRAFSPLLPAAVTSPSARAFGVGKRVLPRAQTMICLIRSPGPTVMDSHTPPFPFLTGFVQNPHALSAAEKKSSPPLYQYFCPPLSNHSSSD